MHFATAASSERLEPTDRDAADLTMTQRETPADIAHRLLWNSSYHTVRTVRCTFQEGVLTMEGRLSSFYLKQIAQTTVKGIEGVDRIENRIEVEAL